MPLDLADVEFRRLAGEHARAIRHQIHTCLSVAVDQGELPAQDVERLARSVQVAYNGALLLWALDPEGAACGEQVRQPPVGEVVAASAISRGLADVEDGNRHCGWS